jgi:hypothetical protein
MIVANLHLQPLRDHDGLGCGRRQPQFAESAFRIVERCKNRMAAIEAREGAFLAHLVLGVGTAAHSNYPVAEKPLP